VPVEIAAFDAIAFDHWLVDLMMITYAYHQSQIGQPWVQCVTACFRMRQGKASCEMEIVLKAIARITVPFEAICHHLRSPLSLSVHTPVTLF
jgi:hypothetical protein